MPEQNQSEPVLLVCIIYGKEFLDLLLEAFLDIGISGATVIHSRGMGHILARDFPLFAGFRELLEAGGPFNYTVLSAVQDPKLVDNVIRILPTLKQDDSFKGILFTVPMGRIVKFNDLAPGKPESES